MYASKDPQTLATGCGLQSAAALVEAFPALGETREVNKALAAWDRWSKNHGQELPLSDDLAAFVDQQVAQGVGGEPIDVVMLALLYYARVMHFLPSHDDED